jgi:hypothetical protein
MSLIDWQKNGWLTSHRTSAHEVADLLAVVERDLADSATEAVSADWRMNIAYNAGLQAATVALAASGFRAARDQHHFRIIQSLRETIGMGAASVATFDAFRKKRNITGYERVGVVSDADAVEMRQLAITIRDEVRAWMRANHPDLLKGR